MTQIDGHLCPTSWRDPKTGTMLWTLAAAYLAPIFAPLVVAALFVIGRAG